METEKTATGDARFPTVVLLCAGLLATCNLTDPLVGGGSGASDTGSSHTADTTAPSDAPADTSTAEDATDTASPPDVSDTTDAAETSEVDTDTCTPTNEVCNGEDDDCDGAVDELCGCTYLDRNDGVCTEAARDRMGECQKPESFLPMTDDESPRCDDRDNDCDGAVDEGCTCDYDDTDKGVCSGQTRAADGTCPEPSNYESTEDSCTDGVDNDCDGATDTADANCRGGAGASCSSDGDCRGVCSGGTCSHRIFVTSASYDGSLSGLAGADQKCNDLAAQAGLSGTWAAILSTDATSAKSRLTIQSGVARLDDTLVADGTSEFWSQTHRAPINQSEQAAEINARVWTGTNDNGTSDGDGEADGDGEYCNGWTVNLPVLSGEAGDSSISDKSTSQGWAENSSDTDPTCDTKLKLYCLDGQ